MRLIGLFLFFPSFCMMLLGLFSMHEDLMLRYKGETLFAEVTGKISSDLESRVINNLAPKIEYEFSIDVENWNYLSRHQGCLPVDIKAAPVKLNCEAKEVVSEKDFLNIKIGQTIPISYRYVPKTRTLNYRILEFTPIKLTGLFNFIMGLIVTLTVCILAIRHVRDSWGVSEGFENIDL